MPNTQPIGIFDSGIGGLSIAQCIQDFLPYENLIYVADSHYAPYGEKPSDFIEDRAFTLANFLLKKKSKALVVACNTATVSTIKKLRSKFSIPIIGVEPGVKPATQVTKSGVIGVLATRQTILSPSFHELVSRFSNGIQVEIQPCPGFVEQVEKIDLTGAFTIKLAEQYVLPLIAKGVDTIVLGCTHYSFLEPVIRKVAGEDMTIINTSTAVAKQTVRRLTEEDLLSPDNTPGKALFFTTSRNDRQENKKIFSTLWGYPVEINHL